MTTNVINNTASNFKVLGVNDDRDFCECCGKEGLKKVVWIEHCDTGDVQHFGTSCAASPVKGFGLKKEIAKAGREWSKELDRRKREESNKVARAGHDWQMAEYKRLGGTDRFHTTLRGEKRAIPAMPKLMETLRVSMLALRKVGFFDHAKAS